MSRERQYRGSKYENGNQRAAHGIISFLLSSSAQRSTF
jgi:hypothetical protein